MNYFTNLIYLLRDSEKFWLEISQNIKIKQKIYTLLIASTILFAIYGAIIGSTHSWMQMLSSAVKLPALYLITLAICLPTLYFFDVLFGSKLNIGQYAALLLSNIAVVSVLLFALAPVTIFILISSPNYRFFLLLNVAIFAITGFFGIKLFYQGVGFLNHRNEDVKQEEALVKETLPLEISASSDLAKNSAQVRKSLMRVWLILYGLVGSQMAWTLRPFVNASGEHFELIRKIESNFYIEVFKHFINLMRGS
ncbi:actin-binding WH2 domain-containing protein [Merismopedia glauca]|uniref:Actin-binding WH2 domain-containing protein n=1 Tax=Merismopedia glauca CCAP 1448/3 TaxID=1296344 RepID=A0A2T1C1M7_9CYAN|nr:actin-binding WH2 domain-containing protein [Merismopedia glauca]PSB02180.1 actin-binding WH2 domain-containing protein [Merismopedia glauca CCAP 1448/3]